MKHYGLMLSRAAIAALLSMAVFMGGCTGNGSTPPTVDTIPSTAPQEEDVATASALEAEQPLEADKPSLKEDFYNATNYEWKQQAEIPQGYSSISVFRELDIKIREDIEAILNELAANPQEKGTKEQRISDFYKTSMDIENRDLQGISPLRPYLEAYANAQDVHSLVQEDIEIYNNTGVSQLFTFSVNGDLEDSDTNVLYFHLIKPTMEKFAYDDDKLSEAYKEYAAELLMIAGEDEDTARENATNVYEFHKALSKVMMNPEEYRDVDKANNRYTLEDLAAIFEGTPIDIKSVISDAGYVDPKVIIVSDVALFQETVNWYRDDNLDVLKAYATIDLITTFSDTLSSDIVDAKDKYEQALKGVQGVKTDKQRGIEATMKYMHIPLGQIYTEKHFPAEAREDLNTMIEEFKVYYKNKINNVDWLSDGTKEKASNKLDTITKKIGYPDKWSTIMDDIAIGTYEEGVCFLDNKCAVLLAQVEKIRNDLNEPVDKSEWDSSVYIVNAFYDPRKNEIMFPAGILQAPFYDINQSKAANLGAIGMVIAHELSHAFDNNGAKFDENGNAVNWWTEEDYANFEELCQSVVDFYDGIEVMPGVTNSGKLTVSENVADLGGISCALMVLEQDENPDYETFFKSFSNMWRIKASPEYTRMVAESDVHSFNSVRVNRAVVNFQQLYDTFDIQEGDGMYVAPEDRVSVW